jgi:5-hydroxyisourate hydrolase-like protein (transthyretin family)
MRAMQASLLTRFGSAAAVAVLATGGVMATATAASAAGHKPLDATTLSIKNKAIAHAKHHADAITGVLRDERTGVASETITLDSRTGKKPRWTVVTTGTTDSTGSVTFTVAPTARTQYKLVFAGDSTFRKSHSNVITLKAVKK